MFEPAPPAPADPDVGGRGAPPWLAVAQAILTDRLTAGAPAPVCVAFSGGSDSLALLRLAQGWGRRAGRRIVALTVDHGLNPDSAAWTAAAARTAARLGVDWRGQLWSGEKPAQGLPATARAARHALLAGAARDLGARVILMGHTADDVAESALIRLDTPGHGRLRQWAPSPAWPQGRDVFLLRPLLSARRAELRDWLSVDGLDWLDDPANADLRFARSRARIALADGRSAGDGGAAGSSDADADVYRWARQVEATPDGRLVLSRQALSQAPDAAVRRIVSAALVCAGGGVRPPRGASLNRLVAAILAGEALASTVAGARIVADRGDDAIAFGRDAGGGGRGGVDALELSTAGRGVFDGRFEILAGDERVRIVAAAGSFGRLTPPERRRLRAIAPWARGVLPAVIDLSGRVHLPAPFGDGPAVARCLVGRRFAAACGGVRLERDLDVEEDLNGEAELATSHAMAL